MSDDWLKMRVCLRNHPKVVRMASALDADKNQILGALFSVWCVFDAHSVDGTLDGYTPKSMDAEVSFPGFTEAMILVSWMVYEDGILAMVRATEHNGQGAKRRAMEAVRKKAERKAAALAAAEAERVRQASALDADGVRAKTTPEKEKEKEVRAGTNNTSTNPHTSTTRADDEPPEPTIAEPVLREGLPIWVYAANAMKNAGAWPVNAMDPELIEACREGATPELLVELVKEALGQEPPITKPFPWAVSVARRRLLKAKTHPGASNGKSKSGGLSAPERIAAANAAAAASRGEANDRGFDAVDEARVVATVPAAGD